jgi:hypothetical protein
MLGLNDQPKLGRDWEPEEDARLILEAIRWGIGPNGNRRKGTWLKVAEKVGRSPRTCERRCKKLEAAHTCSYHLGADQSQWPKWLQEEAAMQQMSPFERDIRQRLRDLVEISKENLAKTTVLEEKMDDMAVDLVVLRAHLGA